MMSHYQVKLIFGVSNGPERMNNPQIEHSKSLSINITIPGWQHLIRHEAKRIRPYKYKDADSFFFYDSFVQLCTEKKIWATCSSQTRIISKTQIENMLMKSCMYEVTFLLRSDSTQSLQQLPMKQCEQYQFSSTKGIFNYCYKCGIAEDAKAGCSKSVKIKLKQSVNPSCRIKWRK